MAFSHFVEDVIQEYDSLVKSNTDTKTKSYRVRVLRRKVDGIMTKLVDIREFLVTNEKAIFTESGVYFNQQELDKILDLLLLIRKEHFRK